MNHLLSNRRGAFPADRDAIHNLGTLAGEMVPYRAEFTGAVIEVTLNPDGTRYHVELNRGYGTHIGDATQLATYRVEVPTYDSATHSLQVRLGGTFVITA